MKTTLITESAYQTIIDVSRQCRVETGGVLVGILGNPLVIVAAGQPGAKAVHHSIRFTTDPEADTECLSASRKVYGLLIEVIGWYHKHYLLQKPSGGDYAQVRLLRDDFKDTRPILMGIVSENGLFRKDMKLRFFSLDDNNTQIEYDWEVIPNDSPEIQKAIQSVPHKPEIKDTHFWNDPAFQSYKNPVGRERICRDIDNLKHDGWKTVVCRSKINDGMILHITNSQTDFVLFLPPEYPLNPPIILTGNGQRISGLKTIIEWNSAVTLRSIVKEAEQIQNCPLCRSRHITNTIDLKERCI